MKFNQEEILMLRRLCQDITSHLLPLNKQECIRDGDKWFCCDWWSIEVLKCLFNGIEGYMGDPPPNRLKNNKLWRKEKIVNYTKNKLSMLDALKGIKDSADNILVCEVGRGIDILLPLMIKEWNKIYCYDSNALMGERVIAYFKQRLNKNIEFIQANSGKYSFDKIEEKMILIANTTKIRKEQGLKIMNNSNIVYAINDGKIVTGENQW